MGHIDHGKTSLLDKIRQSHRLEKESGGITQHIGAYQASWQGKRITFIDTPGHKAFAKMRAHGAKITDLVVLVIAADEGVMAQTEESLRYIKEAGVPFMIALNKVDLPQAQPEKVIDQLAKLGVLVEKKGGEVVLVPVSAKTGAGIDSLLEMILLLSEMNGIAVKTETAFQGVVVESALNRRRGVETAIIVQEGKLRVGDVITCQGQKIKVRAMLDDQGRPCQEAVASQPVLVLGFSSPPPVGSKIYLWAENIKGAPLKSKRHEEKKREEVSAQDTLNLVLKVDTLGMKEAILDALPREGLTILRSEVGDINESDVILASSFGAKIFGFNARVPGAVRDLAKHEGVDIRIFNIIYRLLEEVEKELVKFCQEKEKARIVGEGEIKAVFNIAGQKVAGGLVRKGIVRLGAVTQIWRQDQLLGETKINSLRQGKRDVSSAQKGEEFGAVFSSSLDFLVGDVIKLIKSDSDNLEDKE